jgi:hypothetical protein
MQFLRGKMLAVQKAMESKDVLPQSSEERGVADFPDKPLSFKKEVENSKATAPNSQEQPSLVDNQKRKIDEVPPDADVKRIKISPTLKTECKPELTKTNVVDKELRKIGLKSDLKDTTSKLENEVKQTPNKLTGIKEETAKSTANKKSLKAVPSKPEKSSWSSRDRTPEKFRDNYEQRSRNKRESPDRWRSGYREDWGPDRKRSPPKKPLGSKKISPATYRPHEDKKRTSASRTSEEKSKVDVEVVHIKDSPSPKKETLKEGSGKGFGSVPSPSSIPLPEKPLTKSFAPFSLGRGSKLAKLSQKPGGAALTGTVGYVFAVLTDL